MSLQQQSRRKQNISCSCMRQPATLFSPHLYCVKCTSTHLHFHHMRKEQAGEDIHDFNSINPQHPYQSGEKQSSRLTLTRKERIKEVLHYRDFSSVLEIIVRITPGCFTKQYLVRLSSSGSLQTCCSSGKSKKMHQAQLGTTLSYLKNQLDHECHKSCQFLALNLSTQVHSNICKSVYSLKKKSQIKHFPTKISF